MKIVIIGGVAAGTTAATNARRFDKDAEIIIYEMGNDISYSACGFPYFLGGLVSDIEALRPRGPSFFKEKHNVDVFLMHKVTSIDKDLKEISVLDIKSGKAFKTNYDSLIIATGALPFLPPLPGSNNPQDFTCRNVLDALKMDSYIKSKNPKNIVIAGSGFIGLELLENLKKDDVEITVIERNNKITPVLDQDMAEYLEERLLKYDIKILKETSIKEILNNGVILNNDIFLKTDMVILSIGVRPNVELAKESNIILGETGAISVDKHMETSVSDIFACGDCIETYSAITGSPVYRPLGTTANKTGRIAGENAAGNRLQCMGNLGTGILKAFDLNIGVTGLNETMAVSQGFDVVVYKKKLADKPKYFGGSRIMVKVVADKKSHRILGAQLIGYGGVDKRIDVFAALIHSKAKIENLFHLDLAYAPPFSNTKDPVHIAGMGLESMVMDE